MKTAIVVSILVMVMLGAACGPGSPPLGPRAGSAVSTSARLHVGGSVSIGVIDLARYGGSEPVVLDTVVPNEPLEGVTVLGYAVVTNPGEGVRSVPGFPPKGLRSQSLEGFTLKSGEGPVAVVVGVRLDHEGVHHDEGFTLRYHVGSKHYEQVFHEGISVCSFGFNAC